MNENKKSFWDRPEGFMGAIIPIGLCILGFFMWGAIVPYILTVIQNTLSLVIHLILLGVITFTFINPGTRNLLWFMYKAGVRKLTSLFIETDPIGIMKTYVTHLKEKKEDIANQIENIGKQKGVLNRVISDNLELIKKHQSIANQAEKVGNLSEFKLSSNEIGRTLTSNQKLSNSLGVMENLYEQLERMYKNADYFIRDMEGEIRVKEIEYKTINAAIKATRSAKSIIMGSDLAKKLTYEESLIALSDDMGQKVGEIESFMRSSSDFISKMDLQNGIYDEDGFKALQEMNKNMFISNIPTNQPTTIDITEISKPKSKYLN